jgi:hypothetical protein
MGLAAGAVVAMSVSTADAGAAYVCNVTTARAQARPPAPVPRSFNFGTASLAVSLNPPDGHLVAGRLPTGGVRASINPDGSIDAKYGWWRAGDTRIAITGRRLDRPAPPLRAHVPSGYGRGFQATGITFPTTGCWRVNGAWKNARISFVVRVTKSPLGP